MRDSEMPDERERALGMALRNARIEASLGLRELGRWVGVDSAQLSSWELGEEVPTLEDVAGLLGALGVVGEEKTRIMELTRELAGSSWIMYGSQADTAHYTMVALPRAARGVDDRVGSAADPGAAANPRLRAAGVRPDPVGQRNPGARRRESLEPQRGSVRSGPSRGADIRRY